MWQKGRKGVRPIILLGVIVASWGSKKIAGVDYDLTHLDPFVIQVTPKSPNAPTFNVQVTFGCHTFTREMVATDTPDYHHSDGSETRCFCHIRHGLSAGLPGMIQASANRRAYFSQGRNFLVLNPNVAGGPYVAFFNMEKMRGKSADAAMFVVSAYCKPELPRLLPAVTMPTLVSSIVGGRHLVAPRPTKAY